MSKFRSKLARYNTNCCQQTMPVPVIPICAISCCMPMPICEYKEVPQYIVSPPLPPVACVVSEAAAAQHGIVNATAQTSPIQIPNYCPTLPPPPTGTILTNISETVPSGYLAADGTEVSRTIYSNLFLIIGPYYGDGDSINTFNLPNLSYDGTGCIVSYIIKT